MPGSFVELDVCVGLQWFWRWKWWSIRIFMKGDHGFYLRVYSSVLIFNF